VFRPVPLYDPPKGRHETEEFLVDLLNDQPRGCVLVAAAALDDALGKMLEAYFRKQALVAGKRLDKFIHELLKKQPMPPVGSFAIRTKLAYVLGLLDDQIVAGLDAIRNMRNEAAHLSRRFSFRDRDLRSIVWATNEKDLRWSQGQIDNTQPQWLFAVASLAMLSRIGHIERHPERAAEILATERLHEMFMEDYRQSLSGSSDDNKSTAET
jgi:DNA-binding MltR family transcriptional regulator